MRSRRKEGGGKFRFLGRPSAQRKHCGSQNTRCRPCAPFKIKWSRCMLRETSTASKNRERRPLFLPPEASGNETSHGFFLAKVDIKRGFQIETKNVTCALVAEQSRTRPASSGSTAALECVCMAEGLKKKPSKAEEKAGKRKKAQGAAAKKVKVRASRPADQPPLSGLLSFGFGGGHRL